MISSRCTPKCSVEDLSIDLFGIVVVVELDYGPAFSLVLVDVSLQDLTDD
jgi:hypothetical protein